MRRAYWKTGAAGMVTLLVTMACGPDAPSALPEPGALVVSLATPHADDGAVVFSLRGEEMGSPVALNPDQQVFVLSQDTERGLLRIAVIGARLSGPLVAFDVPDVRRVKAYAATVVEVADQANLVRDGLEGYQARVAALASAPGETARDAVPSAAGQTTILK